MPFPNISICLSESQSVDGIAFLKSARKIVKCLFDGRVKIVHFLVRQKIRTKIQIASPSHRHFSHSPPVLLAVLQYEINPFIIPHSGSKKKKKVFSQAPEQTLWAFLPANAHLCSNLFPTPHPTSGSDNPLIIITVLLVVDLSVKREHRKSGLERCGTLWKDSPLCFLQCAQHLILLPNFIQFPGTHMIKEKSDNKAILMQL